MKSCCDNGPAFSSPECGEIPDQDPDPNRSNVIHIGALDPAERQSCCDFLYKGQLRHEKDLRQIKADLQHLKDEFGLVPRKVYGWIEVK
jgi:hypothetical protein